MHAGRQRHLPHPCAPTGPAAALPRARSMWGMWMFTIPSLRARECTAAEKDALNLLFLAVPLLNVLLPFVSKSFPLIFTADCVLMAGVFASKGLLFGGGGEGEGEQQGQP